MTKKTAIVVGTGFIGEKICSILSDSYEIVAIDNNLNTLKNLDSRYITKEANCLNEKEVEDVFNEIFSESNYPYVLVNSIGLDSKINTDNPVDGFEDFSNQKLVDFENALKINLSSIFLTCQNFYKNLQKKDKEGIILNISSDLGHIAPDHRLYNDDNKKTPNQKPAHYSVSKFGVEGLTKYLAATVSPLIRVNSLCPSGILNKEMNDEFKEKLKDLNPMREILELKNLTGVIKFLTTEDSEFVNGQSILLDGGRSIL